MNVVFITLFDEICIGVRYLSAYLRQAGHTTAFVHLKRMNDIQSLPETPGPGDFVSPPAHVTAQELALFQDTVASLRPGLIAFSFTSNFVALAEHLTRLLRPLGAKIVWGGIDTLADPERALRTADIICRGDGEEAMLELVEALERGGDVSRIANLWVRDGGRIVRNPPRPPREDLDSLPFPDHDLSRTFCIYDNRLVSGCYPDGSQLNYAYHIITARGCPFQCTYCCSPAVKSLYAGHRYYRRRRVGAVIEELRQAKRARGKALGFIAFEDDVFTLHPEWIREFAAAYKRDIALPFWCYTYPTATQREMMARLKDAGLDYVIIGLQSGSQRILDEVFCRRTPRAAILQAVQILHDLDLKIILDLIGSNPFESEADRRETFDLLLELPRPYAIHPVNELTLYKGSRIVELARERPEVWAELQEFENKYMARPRPEYEFWNALHELCQYDCLSRDDLLAFADDAYFREHPAYLKRLVRILKPLVYFDSNISVAKDPYIRKLHEKIGWLERQAEGSFARRLIRRLLGGVR
ncbi:MAG: B12-binding domain-containing radical SAM protein [Candidatus Sumerlaeia bacterium]|nr:B12-binding domain-containing radical SAM protein [Candidatus Sumerlaeia bacterium]